MARPSPLEAQRTWRGYAEPADLEPADLVEKIASETSAVIPISGRYGMSGSTLPALLGFDASGLDYLAPLLDLLDDQLAKIGWRAGKRRTAQVGEASPYLGVVQGEINFPVELVYDFGGRVLRRPEAIPEAHLKTGYEFAYGRDVRQRIPARRAGDC